MIDPATKKQLAVSADGDASPYIIVSLDVLKELEKILKDGNIRYWVDHEAISINQKPYLAVVNLSRNEDPKAVQQLIDRAA